MFKLFMPYLIQGPAPVGNELLPEIQNLQSFGETVWNYFQNVAVILGVIFLIVSAYLYLTALGNDEKIEKAKKSTVYTIVGLGLVGTASMIVQVIRDSVQGNQLNPGAAITLGDQIVGFLFALVMVVATLFLIIAAYQFITAAGDEEKIGKAKTAVTYSVIGLAIMSLAYLVVSVFFETEGNEVIPRIDASRAIDIVVGITEIMLTIIGALSVLMLVWSGLQYVTSRGEEEQMTKAKRAVTGSIIGLLVVIVAWSIVTIVFKIRL